MNTVEDLSLELLFIDVKVFKVLYGCLFKVLYNVVNEDDMSVDTLICGLYGLKVILILNKL